MNAQMNPETQPTQPIQAPPEVMPPAPPVRNLPENDVEASAGSFRADSIDENDGDDKGRDDKDPVIPESENEPKREAPTAPNQNTSKHM